jgi:hypothetical protein
MALIECPDCHEMVSDAAPACPKCGRPTKAREAKLETGKTVKIGCGIILSVFALFFVVGTCSTGGKSAPDTPKYDSITGREAEKGQDKKVVPADVGSPKLNIGLKFFLDKMNAGLKKTGSPRIVADPDNSKGDIDCGEWCVSNYSIGKDAAFVVWHKNDRVNEIMSIVSGDGTANGAIHSIYYQWLVVNILSPGFEREQITGRLMGMFEEISSGRDNSEMALGGVTYKMHKLPGIGITLTATK